jgi:hypothetical protein
MGGQGRGDTMYTHVSKCKNNKIKGEKNKFFGLFIYSYMLYIVWGISPSCPLSPLPPPPWLPSKTCSACSSSFIEEKT